VCVVADEVPIDRKATIRQQLNELASLLRQIDESELAMTFTRVGLLLGKNIRMMARATVAASISGSSALPTNGDDAREPVAFIAVHQARSNVGAITSMTTMSSCSVEPSSCQRPSAGARRKLVTPPKLATNSLARSS